MTKLGELAIQVFINSVKTFLQLLLGQLADRIMSRVVVYVGE
jgi:hypothetical protein